MASSSSNVDSAENLSRWRAMMAGGSQSATGTTSSGTPSMPRGATTSLAGPRSGVLEPTTSALPGFPVPSASPIPTERKADTGGPVPHPSKPLAMPSVLLDSEHTPIQSHGSTSPSSHPYPSPSISGLRAPDKSPQVHASSPQFAPGNTHAEDVGAALAWFVHNLEGGRSLNESMWAPKNGKYAPSPLRGSSVPSSKVRPHGGSGSSTQPRDLTPVNVVQPNPAINDSFSRMTFRAADSDRRFSDNIIGERNIRLSTASRAGCPGVRPIQNTFGSGGYPEHDDMSQPVSPTLPLLAQAAAPNIVQDGITVTDFAEKKENIRSPVSKTAWVPPHLRGKDETLQSSVRSHVGPSDEVMKSLKEDLTKTVEASTGIPSTLTQTIQATHPTLQPEILDKGTISATTQTPRSLAEICQNLMRSILDLESNGYLSAETIASLYAVHGTIQAQLADTAKETTDNYCLPAKTYKDPSRPIQKHLVTTASAAKSDDQATRKANVETPLTIQTDVLDAMVSGSESSTPASGYSSTGLGTANFRKILAATTTSTANSPVATPSISTPEELASTFTSKASASAPNIPDLAKLMPSPSNKIPPTPLDTGAKIAANAPVEKVKAVPPAPAAASKAVNATADAKDTEDRQDQTWFSSWGKREERDRPSAKVRTITLAGLPYNATPSFVASLVYGGNVEYIQMRSSADGTLTASVRFMDADACKQYYNDTSNGIVYKKDIQNPESVAFVELAKDVDVVGGMLQQWIDSGVTRCVRAVGVDEEWGMDGLKRFAEKKGRKLEGISDSTNPAGARSVVFRFCKIEDAVQFKSVLVRDQDWEHCNVHFAVDPCATATGIHLND